MKKERKQLKVVAMSAYTVRPLAEMAPDELKERIAACEVKGFAAIGYHPVANSK